MIELPIFHQTETTSTFKDIGMDYSLADCDIRPVTFFVINAISPYFEGKNIFTSIHSNGSEYICALNLEQVKLKCQELKS